MTPSLRVLQMMAMVILASFAGCGSGPRSGTPITGCPDGVVEYLSVSESGEVEHKEGRFLELVNRKDQKLVIVDLWASWCGPCRMLAPHLTKIKKEWGDKVEVVKVDVDKSRAIAMHLNASSIPDVRIYRNGTQVSDFVGVMPYADIESLLRSLE